MNSNPKVSIAINNYNYARFLPEAIDSALNQNYPHIEVIVVDDGSTDNSREVLASYGDKIIAVLKKNGGQASAFNAGFAASTGDIVCFLDADDTFVPEKAARVVDALGDRSDLGWCFHPLKFVDEKLVEINTKESTKSDPNLFREYDLRELTKSGRFYKNFPYPSTSGLCLKRSLLQQILPMPDKAGSTLLNDAFLIYSSLGLNKGIVLDRELSLYRVHGKNANAIGKESKGKSKAYQQRTAKINILLGYWIGVKFPSFYEFSNHMIATGMGVYLRNGGMDADFKKLVENHLATVKQIDKLKIYIRAFYNFVKNPKY